MERDDITITMREDVKQQGGMLVRKRLVGKVHTRGVKNDPGDLGDFASDVFNHEVLVVESRRRFEVPDPMLLITPKSGSIG